MKEENNKTDKSPKFCQIFFRRVWRLKILTLQTSGNVEFFGLETPKAPTSANFVGRRFFLISGFSVGFWTAISDFKIQTFSDSPNRQWLVNYTVFTVFIQSCKSQIITPIFFSHSKMKWRRQNRKISECAFVSLGIHKLFAGFDGSEGCAREMSVALGSRARAGGAAL